jgi:hypothetical protein
METGADGGASTEEPLDKQVEHVLAEARTVLPGVQALFGFQLIAVFNQRFCEALDHAHQCVHLVALGLVALATALLMTPAAYHRQVEPGRVSRRLVRVGTACLTASMLPVLLAVTLDFYLIAHIILRDVWLTKALPALVGVVFIGLWYCLPASARLARRRAGRGADGSPISRENWRSPDRRPPPGAA